MEEFVVAFPGGKKVEIINGDHSVLTDQAIEDGGDDVAMSPFSLFLASIAACSGIVALSFLRKRNIDTEGLKIRMVPDYDEEANRVNSIKIIVDTPKDFPEKYRSALIKVLDTCTVKKHLINPPEFEVEIN